MSVQDKTTSSVNNPVSVTIGSVTYDHVVSWSNKTVACDGGYIIEPRTTAGSDVPHGYTEKPKYQQINIVVDSNTVESDLTSYVNGAAITVLRYVEKNSASGRVRTVTFTPAESGACRVLAPPESKFVHTSENPSVEFTLAFYGSVSKSAWANP